jgi:hypothetical protein
MLTIAVSQTLFLSSMTGNTTAKDQRWEMRKLKCELYDTQREHR